ncbi:hypothetical protein [Desulfurivibrio dismutans]|nr:hypothetical protein [Desulfurivibrio alkaliphilus]MDF1614371.1 hypothetical protein [Desulfurivibrio alkaliphilus]
MHQGGYLGHAPAKVSGGGNTHGVALVAIGMVGPAGSAEMIAIADNPAI